MKRTTSKLGQLLLIGLGTLSFDLPVSSVRSQPTRSQSALQLSEFPTQTTTVQFPSADQNQLTQLLQQAPQLQQQAWPQLLQTLAAKFEGAAYTGGLLDQSPQEELVLSLSQFDCVLFVETVLAIARTLTVEEPSPQVFSNAVQTQRYRQGHMQGYCSRLHYFSDWIADNQRRGLVENITPALGGILLNKPLNFMSQHRQSYPQLKSTANWQCIQVVETRLQSLPLHYIPQAQIRGIEASLQPGDIIAVATAVPGLDVTHTGLVYQMSDQTKGLIHASPGGSVRIAPDLATYVANVDQSIGIIVARPQNSQQ
ncbi:N-acetylmuramoyl-L-alanine amidase-like domain-containing protein [Acaryochloris marina]|uniref:N-acetylmuramoyl-L-alanine amidase-like domain-containing protein n=1 Tax=Acaryochloris marina TaxID=155978 RepID=UPI002017A35D|nr:N-acetylmuramoyl-L-alanine amidase-like domain-containing protein [Acaryochloris marina]